MWFGVRQIEEWPTLLRSNNCFPVRFLKPQIYKQRQSCLQYSAFVMFLVSLKTWSKLIFIHYSYGHILKNRHSCSRINLSTTIQFRNQPFAVICWMIATTADLNCCFPFHSNFHVSRHHLATRRMHRGHYPTTLHALLSTYHVLCLFVLPSLFTGTRPTFVPNCTALLTGLLCYSTNTPVKTHNSVMA